MDFIWVLFAFGCGLGAKTIKLPPLVGYLIAGFLANLIGIKSNSSINLLADMGITLMLFTIGLKLNIKDLTKPEIWLGANIHMLTWIAIFSGIALSLAPLSLPFFTDLNWKTAAILAFGLSFSSTVCVVKMLEEAGEMKTRHGKLAIGVLVMQDVIAVIFLVIATGKIPSVWALGLPLLIFLKPFFNQLLKPIGHGELLPLTGFCLAFGGYELFHILGIKGDLGALIFGMLLSENNKASEIAKSLLNFKDLFLIGFFLSIGLTTLPTWPIIITALGLSFLIIIKFVLFYGLFLLLKLRARTAFLAALGLSNFSEFGLIVASYCVDAGWLAMEWLVILAIALSFSFVITGALYRSAHNLFSHYKGTIKFFERNQRLPEDSFPQPENAEVLIIGMGRVGKGAYKALSDEIHERVWGVDADNERVEKQRAMNHQILAGDAEDPDFWEDMDLSKTRLILLALPSIEDAINITHQLRNAKYEGLVAAIARYSDEREKLLSQGIDRVFNFFTEAGAGFAEESLRLIEPKTSDKQPEEKYSEDNPVIAKI